uniref:DUF4346 domain-containing protein n=1 Tax=Dermonema virens TaxID=1077399 RepID=A0A1G4NRM2_9FLOR|nr:Hypothetical protein ORF_1 [Dermonema virens]SCW21311.1 Hypothetical protein ORF_1 [Dermonema virens]
MKLDNNIYCKISLVERRKIRVKFYFCIGCESNKISHIIFYGYSAGQINELIGMQSLLFQYLSLGHSVYIGIELAKAEVALKTRQIYVQN